MVAVVAAASRQEAGRRKFVTEEQRKVRMEEQPYVTQVEREMTRSVSAGVVFEMLRTEDG